MDEKSINWFITHIQTLDPNSDIISLDIKNNRLIYDKKFRSDETLEKQIEPEELVKALSYILLCSGKYRYEHKYFFIERHYSIGRPSSSSAEVDLIIYDQDDLAFSAWEFKSPDEYNARQDYYIKSQLFDTAPQIGAAKYLVYATIFPNTDEPEISLKNIDYQEYTTYESWVAENRQSYDSFPPDYEDEDFRPLEKGTDNDLKTNVTHKEFKAIFKSFHQEFFGEKQDTDLFRDILKLLLAKIFDEKTTKNTVRGRKYKFQILHSGRKEESSNELFPRIQSLYKDAYRNYIEPNIDIREIPDLSPTEFSPDKVKFVVRKLQKISITKNSANQGDIVGSFFEEVLRDGFRQDSGMYFTHSNLVYFMVEALDIKSLTRNTFKNANHPTNRMPYIIDPACGSGTFLLVAMNTMTKVIKDNIDVLAVDDDSIDFIKHHLSDSKPNHWAKDFIYGLDPKFVMALTSKVNMVLHGDGSAHIYKYDGLSSFSDYKDSKLNELPITQSTVKNISYGKPVCERFDAILTNPPFGITIEENVRRELDNNFTLSHTSSSESLFFERWFHFLKPKGRLAAVLPESFFNTAENIQARLMLYKFFNIKAIVSLPQNLFVDTPTLTSLLFAQKKTKTEIEDWDSKWRKYENEVSEVRSKVINKLRERSVDNLKKFKNEILTILSSVIDVSSYIIKKGKSPLKINPINEFNDLQELKDHYKAIMRLASFKQLLLLYIFNKVAGELNYDFKTYCIDQVGYKLSKRNEKAKPNYLCTFKSIETGDRVLNLHLTHDQVEVKIDIKNPSTVLDLIKREVIWES